MLPILNCCFLTSRACCRGRDCSGGLDRRRRKVLPRLCYSLRGIKGGRVNDEKHWDPAPAHCRPEWMRSRSTRACVSARCAVVRHLVDQVPPFGHSNTVRWRCTIGTLIASVFPGTRKIFTFHYTGDTRDDVRIMLVDNTKTLASSSQTRLPKDGISP